MLLKNLGWNQYFKKQFETYDTEGVIPLRVVRDNRTNYMAVGEKGEFRCEVSGKYRYGTQTKSEYPAVGDWVVATARPEEEKATIHSILTRKNTFSRKVPGEVTEEQVIAANIDTIFIVTGLDQNYNLRRIERYLSVAWETGATPFILLNKADLCGELETILAEVNSIAFGTKVMALSATEKEGIELLREHIGRGKTVAFLGSSGVGKSTIINALIGDDYLKVNEVNKVGNKGRHTTTHRELIVLPDGGMVIDTPGMRELQVWGEDEGLKQVFDDIERLAAMCQYRDCNHENEPGCAIREALNVESLSQERYSSYLKLKKEYEYLANRQKMKASAIEKAKWKDIRKVTRQLKDGRKNR